jgi:hypothetical protein
MLSTADQTTKVDHEITINLRGGNALAPDPMPAMKVGETVRYTSTSGKVRIVFAGSSPYRIGSQTKNEVLDSEIVTLISDGEFTCRCFITPPNGTEVGWDPKHPHSGGVHKVSKP